ncbi:ATP-binding protein [Gottschalkiaceae bacterium SANA]|nr:ATP-binding protein [Gottschalkiaceae bacterium SANA]
MQGLNQILVSEIGINSRRRSKPKQYNCSICKDTGWVNVIGADGREACRRCECFKRQKAVRALKASGIAGAFQNRTLDNYIPKTPVQADALKRAKRFVEVWGKYDDMHMNFLLLGQNGAGKTHLSIGIANELIKKNVLVRYVTFHELMDIFAKAKGRDKQIHTLIDQYKKADLLVIDDVFRTTIREWNGSKSLLMSHIDAMFRIIDYRYFQEKGMVITSELTGDGLLDLDQAITGRLLEYARGNIVEFKDSKLDHRIYGE